MHDHSVDDSSTKNDRLSDTCSDTVDGHGSTGDTRQVNITENCQLMTLFNNYLAPSDR